MSSGELVDNIIPLLLKIWPALLNKGSWVLGGSFVKPKAQIYAAN